MNKQTIIKAGIVFLAVLFVAGLAVSCGDSSSSAGSSAAALTGITISGKTPDQVPMAITPAQWNDDEFYFTDEEYTGTVYLNSEADLANAQLVVEISGGAKAAYGLASAFDRPETFSSGNTVTITLGQALYVRVTSEDGKNVNYYRFAVLLQNSNSNLSTLTVAGMAATLGTPAASLGSVGGVTAGRVALSNANKTNAPLVGTPVNNKAAVAYALRKTAGIPAADDFTDTATYSFDDGDTLYVRVTAENGQNFSYYRINVQIGRDATLKSVVIGETEASSLGTPKTAWGTFTSSQRGSWQADERQPDAGFAVVITSNDAEATVVWAGGIGTGVTAQPGTYDGESPFVFPSDQSDMVIKVTSANGAVTNWYRIRLITKSWTTVYYGTPELDDPDDAANEEYIDPIWDAEEWLDISRVNTAESYASWFATDDGQHTTARAKALWDDDGLWVYWDIDFMDYSDDGGAKTRTASRSGGASTYSPGTDITAAGNSTPDAAHQRDSVELFINERFQSYREGNYGNQYRSGLPNATDGTIWLSGEKGNPPTNPYFNSIVQFQIDKMVRAWVKKDGAGKETGYVIIMRAQWVKKYDAADINAVFNTDGTVKDDAEIGLELQINACSAEGTRDGILTWNGVTSMAYTQVRSFGIVTLKRDKS